MLLQNKNAVIYGAAGSLGSTVAKAFATAGAKVFLTGRNLSPLQNVADKIIASGGRAETALVDAMDEKSVSSYLETVVEQAGSVDISFNLIDLQVIQGMPLIDMQVADFVRPVSIAMQTHFITDTAAAKIMEQQRSGVILSLTATPGGVAYPGVGGFGPACCAIESFSKNLAAEMGGFGVRVVNIRSAGSPDSAVFKNAAAAQPEEMKVVFAGLKNDTMLKKLPPMADIANLAVFLASDLAASITGVTVDSTSGSTSGLNYRFATMFTNNK